MANEKKGLNISTRSFVVAVAVILGLMILTYIITLVVPAGEYLRVPDENGELVIGEGSVFSYVEGGIPFWKWLLSPVLVLTAEGSGTIIAVTAFLLVLGGVFNTLEKRGLLQYMLGRIIHRYGHVRYTLMAAVTLFFMAMGTVVGSFEECVPMVPIVVALAVGLGWDALTGMGMSLLAAGCGFAAGVCNPFTVGVAQGLAGLPMFSGLWLRAVAFVLIYALLSLFLRAHARRVERPAGETGGEPFRPDGRMDRGLVAFAVILGAGFAVVILSAVLTFLQDYTMIVIAVMFLTAGLTAVKLAGMEWSRVLRTFLDGLVSILPAVAMILMASSIKYTLTEAKVLDTVLHGAVELAGGMPRAAVVLFIYLLVLCLNFFIPSGSAKAFLLMPLLIPMARLFGISAQLCVLAYAFGDGFSNAFYPTNPVLLISLGLSDVSYGRWARWSGVFQLANLVLTSCILLFGLAVGY